MRVLLLGATGSIGSAVLQELLRRGHAVVALARSDASAARIAAAGVANIKGLECEVDRMQTNLVFFEVKKPGWTSARLVEACKERGVGIGSNTATRIRAVTHLDVSRADIDVALKVISDVLAA